MVSKLVLGAAAGGDVTFTGWSDRFAFTVEPWHYVKMMMEVGFVNVEFVDFTSFKTTTITVGARFRAKKRCHEL